jgi:hypothetical protein
LASFYRCLYSCKLRGDREDKVWWVPSCKGIFEVKSFYRALSPCGSLSFPSKSIWRSKAPPRVAFLLGRLLAVRYLPWIILGGGVWLW